MSRRIPVVPLIALIASGCASTGSTLKSGVGDVLLEHPPYYAGPRQPLDAAAAGTIGHMPITFQAGPGHSSAFNPSKLPALDTLLLEMNRYLDSLGVSKRLVEGGQVSAVAHRETRTPPDVRFGCETFSGDPWGDCEEPDENVGRNQQRMRLAVGRPAQEWVSWASQVMADNGADRTLVITLEIGQYWARQRGWRGDKELELGTGLTRSLPWLTSLETPVAVLQLTGALVGPDGRAIRIGAEGLHARRTRLLLSAIGAQELVRPEDIEQLRSTRRDDQPGRPLLWQTQLRELVRQLTGREPGPLTPGS